MQESSYRMGAKGIKCGISLTTGQKDCVAVDFGIGQINYKTIKNYKLDKKRLMIDITYSIDAAAKVLADFKRFKKSEPDTWYCRYNAGTGNMSKIEKPCNKYVQLVARHM